MAPVPEVIFGVPMPHVLRRCLFWLGAITLALPHWAYAESAQSPAPVVGTSGHLLSMTVGLLLIIVLIFALAWLLRRFGQGGLFMQQKSIKIVAALALGTRERKIGRASWRERERGGAVTG